MIGSIWMEARKYKYVQLQRKHTHMSDLPDNTVMSATEAVKLRLL